MGCPDENTALGFIEGRLVPAEARSLEAHVDSCPRCYSMLTELARVYGSDLRLPSRGANNTAILDSGVRHTGAALDAPRHASSPPPSGLTPGALFASRYRVLSCVGAGGMGVVYAAFDDVLQRKVALKLVRPDVGREAETTARILDEARAIARLSHPNVVAVYDAGIHDGRLYLAMELIEGPNLAIWLRSHPRQREEIIGAALQVAEGLAAMHAAGLVHRDVKPQNILMGGDGRVRVTDFGLAHAGPLSGAIGLRGSDATEMGALIGTPAYMSPEQLYARPADPRSDQFSFAVTLVEALLGQRPFVGRTIDELRWAMSASGPRMASGGLPRWLDAVLRRALTIDPAGRYPSMFDLARAMREAKHPSDSTHVVLNAVFNGLFFFVHVAFVVGFLVSETSKSSQSSPSSPSSPSTGGPDLDGPIAQAAVAFLVIWVFAFIVWLPLGVLWTPLNAYGLHRRRDWARISTMIYAILSLFTCLGTPYGIYALVSLSRSQVKAVFKQNLIQKD